MSAEAIYRAARADGQDSTGACHALMASGVSFDAAAELCWAIETGKPNAIVAREGGVER